MGDPDFVNIFYKHDVIFLSECWFSETEASSITLRGYKVFTKARKKKEES